MINFKRLRDEFFPQPDPFDLKFGTDTSGVVSLRRLWIKSANKSAGVHYKGIDEDRFTRATKCVPKDGTFIDFGCGKGRALIFAHQAGFKRLIGVEFSSTLARIARANMRRLGIAAEIFEQDASTFLLPKGACIVFMYNPFRPPVFDAVIANLAAHGKVFVIYANPEHKHVITCTDKFAPLLEDPNLFVAWTPFRV